MSKRCRRCSTRSDTSRRSSRRSDTSWSGSDTSGSWSGSDTSGSWSGSNTSEDQRHVHEFQGSTEFAEWGSDRHNHRFAGVSGEAIGCGRNHYHCIRTRTDTTEGHFHEICERTGPAVYLNNGCGTKHIHFFEGKTSRNDDHRHCYSCATLIADPTGES